MESTGVLDTADYGGASKEVRLTNESIGYLKETAKWSTFLAIMGFIFSAIMIIAGIFMAVAMSSLDMPGMPGGMGGIMGTVYILLAAIYIYPTLQLYNFAKKCKKAVAISSTDLMTTALGHLKSCFKFMGILMVIILGIYALMIVFGGLGALMM